MAESGTVGKPEEFLAFLKGYSPERAPAGEQDLIAGRYLILANQPLPEFSSSYANAYAVRDEKSPETSLYALAFENGVPLRQKNIQMLKTYRHRAMVSLLADGVARVGNETRYMVVLERPAGQRLSERLQQRGESMAESQIINQFLRPLSEVLVGLLKMGISHNRIHPGNIFISGSSMVLGECVGEPSGFSQEPIFEPIDRMLTSPRAKADYAPGADCYAFGMLALHLALGFAPFTTTDKKVLISNILALGPYHALIMPWDLPGALQDLLRGIFGEGRRDKWDALTIESWLGGRRFNLVMPTSPRETARGFEFEGTTYFNRRSLAHALSLHWKAAKELLTDTRLPRWLKAHVHKPEAADAITRLMALGSERTAQQEDETLARILILLDPTGPIRFKQIAVSVEGVGALLANALTAERDNDARALTQMIDNDLIGFWIEQQKPNSEYTQLTGKLQKARQHSRMKGLGFGMERSLYDLNPNLPCLSPMLGGQHVTTPADALSALDTVAREKAATENVGDEHIAAFLASKLDINREIKIHELPSVFRLAPGAPLVMLKLLAQAQRKAGEMPLKGLCNWLALKLLPLLEHLHNRQRAVELQAQLRSVAARGSLEALATLFLGSQVFNTDTREFQRASADYIARSQQIAALKGTSGLAPQAGIHGRGIAQSIAYGICIATIYVTLKSYFSL